MTRREILAGLSAAPLLAQDKRPRIAAIVTTYHWYSHADVILGRIMSGCSPNNKWHAPRCQLVSLYTEQLHERDMSADVSARAGFTIYDSIEKAITAQPVDGVIFIGEHGNYPDNELGQKLYPRYEMFSKILDVYEKTKRPLPTFFDKHLSYTWEKADAMFRRVRQMGFAFQAGSSIPLSLRVPYLVPEIGVNYNRAIALGYGGLDAYGFHTLESLQCMVERRGTKGETGVASVEMVTGPTTWDRARDWQPLIDAALKTIPKAPANYRERVKNPALFVINYRDGLKGACLMLDGAIQDWAFAASTPSTSKIESCKFGPATKARPLPHFDGLVHNIEEMFLNNRAPYPAERTLLTTGILAKLFESKKAGRAIDTPELSVTYRAPLNPFVQTA